MTEENQIVKKKIIKRGDKVYEYDLDRYDIKSYLKKYNETHREQIKENKRLYYQKKMKEHHNCEVCGGHYELSNKSRHEKSKNHLFCLNLINELSNKNKNI